MACFGLFWLSCEKDEIDNGRVVESNPTVDIGVGIEDNAHVSSIEQNTDTTQAPSIVEHQFFIDEIPVAENPLTTVELFVLTVNDL